MLGLDLAGLVVDPQPDVGIRLANGADLDPAVEVDGGNRGVLGHPVQLIDGNPEAHEEDQHLGSDRRSPRSRPTAATQPNALLERRKNSGLPMA